MTRKLDQTPNGAEHVSPSLEAWLPKLQFSTETRDGNLYIDDVSIELSFKVAKQANTFSLSASWRGGMWRPVMYAQSIYHLEVAVVNALFPGCRLLEGLSRLAIPYEWNMAAVGFVPQQLEDGWTTLMRKGSQMPFRMDDSSVVGPVTQYSYFSGFSISELIAAVESPDGGVVASRIAARMDAAAQDGPAVRGVVGPHGLRWSTSRRSMGWNYTRSVPMSVQDLRDRGILR